MVKKPCQQVQYAQLYPDLFYRLMEKESVITLGSHRAHVCMCVCVGEEGGGS